MTSKYLLYSLGDRVWRMPLWKFYTKEIVHQSSVDITNHTRFHGDSCTGAAFLREFIEDVCWLHLDVTGNMNPNRKHFVF